MSDRRRSLRDYATRREGPHLEFKDPRVLSDPYAIAREVCAFLNSGGGEVVVGIGDDGRIQPVVSPEPKTSRLRDRLLSLIAPSLLNRVRVEVLEGDGILVTVDPPGDGRDLFAVRSPGGRFGVFRRVEDRITALDWAEIREVLRDGQDPGAAESAEHLLVAWRSMLEKESAVLQRTGGLLLVGSLDRQIGPARAREAAEFLGAAIEDPGRIGLRRRGVHYFAGECERKRHTLSSGSVKEVYRALELDLRGSVRFATRLDVLLGDRVPGCPRRKSLYPLSIVETIVSCTTLFGALIEATQPGGMAVCAADLVGIDGHSLPPYPHGTYGFANDANWKDPHEGNGIAEILKVSSDARSLGASPHRVAHELVIQVYEEFGYSSRELGVDGENVPYWNPEQARFVFPS